METHNRAVAAIAAQTREFYERKEPFRIYHGFTNSTRPSQLRRDQLVDTSGLTNVLQVDVQTQTVLVEPNVPMDDLVKATLPYKLIPPVVMEFPGITAGGGFAGQAGESSSFRYGLFDRTVTWFEIVLANGEVKTASKDENADLFYGAPASFGTLGITTLLRIDLIPAKTYVELTYHPVTDMTELVQKVKDLTEDPTTEYIDGIVFSLKSALICSGRLADTAGPCVRRFTRATDPWFYRHAEKLLAKSSGPVVESIPVTDYFFRYDRGTFWTGLYAFRYFVTPFNRVTRYVLDYFMHTRVMYHALHKSGFHKQYMIQDVAVPYKAAVDFLQYVDQSFGHYPIWVNPVSQSGRGPKTRYGGLLQETPESKSPDQMINIGIWGPGSTNRAKFVEQNRNLEQKVQALNGRKWLYAHAYYTKEEFWKIYDRKFHDDLRATYHATHLPTVYDKVNVDFETEQSAIKASWIVWFLAMFWSIWPLSGLYGVCCVLVGGDYLLPRKPLRSALVDR